MKHISYEKSRKSGYQSDDDNVRYKLNTDFFNSTSKAVNKIAKTQNVTQDDDTIRYKFPKSPIKSKTEKKPKSKTKIKVNFWSNKQSVSRLNKPEIGKENNRRHTVGGTEPTTKTKNPIKVRKQVSFLPSPIFSENHVPMVTVPDDLTIQLNEEEANYLREDLKLAFVNSKTEQKFNDSSKQKVSTVQKTSSAQSGPKKRKRSLEDTDKSQGNEYELEFFSKYVVQKLRRMETNQRIYSENLINTVLMLGQLGKLNGKSKILEP